MVDDSSMRQQKELYKLLNRDEWKDTPDIKNKILSMIDTDRIRENLREFSKEPHVAGTQRDEDLARYIQNTWLQNGFDSAHLVPYRVLLSHPNPQKPNMINVLGASNEVYLNIIPLEIPLQEADKAEQITQGFHAYTPSGTVQGELVFAMDGSPYDFELLEELNVDVKGKIVLVTERSVDYAIQNAYEHGAVGVLSFPDPMFYSRVKTAKENLYPNSTLLPGSGMITTPILAHYTFGDLLTPGYPATETAYRASINNDTFTQILSQPIGYADALKLLKLLDGPTMPKEWLTNPEFQDVRIGSNFSDPSHRTVQLVVNNRMKETKIYNVIGTIKGSVEPDRYIIYGNHRDAWSFGAVDPASGTSVMMELSRVFGELIKEGWRPRRTIVFASWSGEEYGLIGSTEWVEEKLPKLHHRAVMYINTDICAIGKHFFPTAANVLDSAIFHVAKQVPDPEGIYDNVYETMRNQSINGNISMEPRIADFQQSGIMSDHVPFTLYGVIPYMDVNWRNEFSIMSATPVYETYHTGYDTFHYMDKFVDPTYKFHRSCAQLSGLMMHYVADSLLIPFNLTSYMEVIEKVHERMTRLNHIGINVDSLTEAKDAFQNTIENWYKMVETADIKNPMIVRMLNDQIMQLERSSVFFMSPRTVRSTADERDIPARSVFIRSINNIFRSIHTFATMLESEKNGTDAHLVLEIIRGSLSDLTLVINQSAQTLQPFHVI